MSAGTNLQVEGAVDTVLFCAKDVCEVGSHGWTSVTSVGWIVFVYGEDIRWMVVEVGYIGATR